MLFPKTDHFLKQILHYIKFSFDKKKIKTELKNHIMDKIDYYTEQGYDNDRAEELSIIDMGDAKEIGLALNKQHNPILGWIWKITNVMVVLLVLCNIFVYGASYANTIFRSNRVEDIPKSSIVYQIDLNKKVQIDDTIIRFTNVVYDIEGDLNIYYEYYDTEFWSNGGVFLDYRNLTDNLGNHMMSGPSYSSGGYKTYCTTTFEDFSKEADSLIINYDEYNRSYTVKIPLKVGESHE